MRETWVQSLGQENPLEKEMAIHSSILAWRILWSDEPGRLVHRVTLSVILELYSFPHLLVKQAPCPWGHVVAAEIQ